MIQLTFYACLPTVTKVSCSMLAFLPALYPPQGLGVLSLAWGSLLGSPTCCVAQACAGLHLDGLGMGGHCASLTCSRPGCRSCKACFLHLLGFCVAPPLSGCFLPLWGFPGWIFWTFLLLLLATVGWRLIWVLGLQGGDWGDGLALY